MCLVMNCIVKCYDLIVVIKVVGDVTAAKGSNDPSSSGGTNHDGGRPGTNDRSVSYANSHVKEPTVTTAVLLDTL